MTVTSVASFQSLVNVSATFRQHATAVSLVGSFVFIEVVPSSVPARASSSCMAKVLRECFYPFVVSSSSRCSSHIRVSDPNAPNLSFYSEVELESNVVLGNSEYAIMSKDGLRVDTCMVIDPVFINNVWESNEYIVFLPVVQISFPSFDPTTQYITRSGWTVFSDHVEPIWSVMDGIDPTLEIGIWH